MTRAEAKARAEEIVYVRCVFSDIVRRCIQANISVLNSRGKLRPRAELEDELIKHYTDLYSTESEDTE